MSQLYNLVRELIHPSRVCVCSLEQATGTIETLRLVKVYGYLLVSAFFLTLEVALFKA